MWLGWDIEWHGHGERSGSFDRRHSHLLEDDSFLMC